MRKTEKVEAIEELKERIKNHSIVIAAKYIGINAEQATILRRKLREKDVALRVFKNTLARRALDELNLSEAAKYMDGPTAWAFSNDPVAAPKVLREFGKELLAVEMNGGILDGKVVSKVQLEQLASLPPREILLGQVVGTIGAPLRNLVGVLSAVPRNLVNVLDQIRRQKEEGAAAA